MEKVQFQACRWITGVFRTTPTGALEMAAGIMPINQTVNKLIKRAAYRINTLSQKHAIHMFLPSSKRTKGITPETTYQQDRFKFRKCVN